MTRDPINVDNGDLHHEALEAYQMKNDKGKETQKILFLWWKEL